MGRVDAEKLAELYRKAWVFCLPSTYEGFGVPYIEAMASGTAVVASTNPGAIEVTVNGTCGVIAKDDELAEKIIEILRDSAFRQRLEVVGLKRSQDFSWDTVCSAYEELFVLGEKTPAQVAA